MFIQERELSHHWFTVIGTGLGLEPRILAPCVHVGVGLQSLELAFIAASCVNRKPELGTGARNQLRYLDVAGGQLKLYAKRQAMDGTF